MDMVEKSMAIQNSFKLNGVHHQKAALMKVEKTENVGNTGPVKPGTDVILHVRSLFDSWTLYLKISKSEDGVVVSRRCLKIFGDTS